MHFIDNSQSELGQTILNLTIRASLAPRYTLFCYTIFTQGQKGQKVKYINPKTQITTRARRKHPIGRFSSSPKTKL